MWLGSNLTQLSSKNGPPNCSGRAAAARPQFRESLGLDLRIVWDDVVMRFFVEQ